MDAFKVMAVVLMMGGALGLIYGGFFSDVNYAHVVKLGSFKLSVTDEKAVLIGAGAFVMGSTLLLFQREGNYT